MKKTVENVNLSEPVDDAFKQLLAKHADTFAHNKMDYGFCPIIAHDIDTGDSPRIRQSPRKPPLYPVQLRMLYWTRCYKRE